MAAAHAHRGIAFEIFGFETCAKKTLRIRKLHVGIDADSIPARDAIEKPNAIALTRRKGAVPLAVEQWYEFPEFGAYSKNVGRLFAWR